MSPEHRSVRRWVPVAIVALATVARGQLPPKVSSEPRPRKDYEAALEANLDWLLHSGVMDPADGSKGVADRLILPGEVIADRRPDVQLLTALAFRYGATILRKPEHEAIANALFQFTVQSGLQDVGMSSVTQGLFRRSDKNLGSFGVETNVWSTIAALQWFLLTSEMKAVEIGMRAGEGLLSCDDLRDATGSASIHGLRAMTLAFINGLGGDGRFAEAAARAFQAEPIPALLARPAPFASAEVGHVLLEAAVLAHVSHTTEARRAMDRIIADLIKRQGKSGEFLVETTADSKLVDLAGIQTPLAIALYHAWKVSGDAKCRAAFYRALNFLVAVQGTGDDPRSRGAWPSAFDVAAWTPAPDVTPATSEAGSKETLEVGSGNALVSLLIALTVAEDSFLPDLAPMDSRRADVRATGETMKALRAKRLADSIQSRKQKAIDDHVASFGAAVVVDPPPRAPYTDVIPSRLTDGFVTEKGLFEHRGLGFRGATDVTITVALERPLVLRAVRVHLVGGGESGCELPSRVDVAVSADGKAWTDAGVIEKLPTTRGTVLHWATLRFERPETARSVRFVFRAGAGAASAKERWLMVDEIEVRS